MERYEAYKDSGVEWIGEIPVGWKTARMGTSCYLKGRIGWQGLKAEEFIDDGPYLVTGTDFCNGRVNWKTCYHISQDRFEEAPEIHVRNGDLLITKDGTIGKLALICDAPNAVSLNSHLLLMRPLDDQIDSRFLFWVLSGEEFSHYTDISQSGTIMASLSQDKIARFIYALPSVVEQQAIADYLDAKTAEIDGLVADCEREVELLREYRKAIISEAVTKGLDPNAPMKDSGVELIGEIPEGWAIKKLRYCGTTQNGISKAAEFFGTGSPFISYGNVYRDELNSPGRYGLVESSDEEREKYSVKRGDILFTRTSETIDEVGIAAGALSDIPDSCFAGFLIRFRPDEDWGVTPEYAAYFFRSDSYRPYLTKEMMLVTRASLSQQLLGGVAALVPPLVEQQAIVAILDAKTVEIDALIDNKRQMIEKLREYRKSLISEAVTGKFKVPGV